jgi:hypothetical protein
LLWWASTKKDNDILDGAMLALEVISAGNEEFSILYRSQLVAFASRSERFNWNAARINALNPTMMVLNWWHFYGGDTPELRALAIKVLFQPISTYSAESMLSYSHENPEVSEKNKNHIIIITIIITSLSDHLQKGDNNNSNNHGSTRNNIILSQIIQNFNRTTRNDDASQSCNQQNPKSRSIVTTTQQQ